ncbi:major facilitator superfamily transporter MHS family protein [Rhodococcus ruber BKS 20-38]|uniref:Major facilitator superfamily transporter MHS family protein n=1 Tax=Rhodococcus ruber BKS 20-38 TaxID=1278076 RepID=M2Z6G6_9NOCA|nr:MFS transporter [Rhodococcus ruber]EME56249.1 major facilitator superfamily transporter MHS family protein [Rhodococcus ruber BKS 20-38]
MAGISTSTIEYYDFLLYGTMAALVFNKVFFPSFSAAAGTLASFATFAFGFIARPIGSLVFGRMGDRIGRKRTLMISLTMMGLSTLAIGLMPTYEMIGMAAPLLLVAMRFLQGLSLGGEWAGASLVLIENSKPGRENFMASMVQIGSLGLVLSSLATTLASKFTGEHFTTWGWRLPFLLGFVMFLFTFWIRRNIEDSAEYTEAKAQTTGETQLSLVQTLATYWRPILLGFFITGGGVVVYFTITTYGIAYATGPLGYNRTSVLDALTIAAVVYSIAIPVAGWCADRWSPRGVLVTGFVFGVLLSFPFFWLLGQGVVGVFVGLAMYLALSHALIQAPQAVVYGRQFPPLARYTGTALSHSLPTAIVGGTAPVIAQALLNATGSNLTLSFYIFVMAALGAGAAYALTKSDSTDRPRRKGVRRSADSDESTTHSVGTQP